MSKGCHQIKSTAVRSQRQPEDLVGGIGEGRAGGGGTEEAKHKAEIWRGELAERESGFVRRQSRGQGVLLWGLLNPSNRFSLALAAGVSEAAAPGRQTSLPHGAAEVRGDEGPAAALPANAPTAAAAPASPAPGLPACPTCGRCWATRCPRPGSGSSLHGPCLCGQWGPSRKLGPL